jgi:hypothetical protein
VKIWPQWRFRIGTKWRLTFAISGLISQYGTLFNVSVAVEQLANIIFSLLFVQHSDEQLPVVCTRTQTQKTTQFSDNISSY